MFLKSFIPFILACLFVFTPFFADAQVNQGSDAESNKEYFTINDIAISAASTDAESAKKTAIQNGQIEAFKELVWVISQSYKRLEINKITSQEILNTVKSYTVENEEILGGKKYKALMNVSFNPDLAKNLLYNKGIKIVENFSAAKPSLLITGFRKDGKLLIWDHENPWFNALGSTKLNSNIVPILLPAGDLDDMNIINALDIESANYSGFTRLAEKYDAGSVTFLEAEHYDSPVSKGLEKGSRELELKIRYFNKEQYNEDDNIQDNSLENNFQHNFQETMIISQKDRDLKSLLQESAIRAVARLEINWKKFRYSKTAISINQKSVVIKKGLITAMVPINSASQWVEIRKRLEQVKEIGGYVIKEFDSNNVKIDLEHSFQTPELQGILARYGLSLNRDNTSWVLALI